MRRQVSLLTALAAVFILMPVSAHAAEPTEGAAVSAQITARPIEAPDSYRVVDGKREPVYAVAVGDVLHVDTRFRNTGVTRYWTFRGDFVAQGADVFATPGIPKHVEGLGGSGPWGTSIGVPADDPDPDRNHPYTRRTMQLNKYVNPGQTVKQSWPLTVDSLPAAGVYYEVSFRYETSVSDPPLYHSIASQRVWLVAK